MSGVDLDHVDLERLRARHGAKWSRFPGTLAAFVAEMDFPVAPSIRRVLEAAVEREDFGYPFEPRPEGLPTLFAERMRERFDWVVEPRRVELLPDVVQGIYLALSQFSEPGEGAIVQTPIYPPFLRAVRETGRRLVENPLVAGPGGYEIDFDGLRRAIDPRTRMLLLCNPHNPSGRAFRRDELETLAEIAEAHDLIVLSDEIHQDLVFAPARHLAFASLSPETEARTVTLTSATKSFNMPGLRCALAVFGSPELKRRFLGCPRHMRGGMTALGIEATEAAWREGGAWLAQVLDYLRGNRALVDDFLRDELPELSWVPPEATYLAWLDCRRLELERAPAGFFREEAGVALGPGEDFGLPGEGFARLTFATPRSLLREMLERMAKAVRARG